MLIERDWNINMPAFDIENLMGFTEESKVNKTAQESR